MSTTTLKQITVLIDRDASTTIPATIFEYELPVLEQIYNEEQLTTNETKSVKVEDFDAEKAYDGLKTKYRSSEGTTALKTIYPNLAAFKKAIPVAKKGAAGNDDEGSDDASLSEKTVAKIKEALPDLSDEEIDQLESDENAKDSPRAGVLSAIEAERASREAE